MNESGDADKLLDIDPLMMDVLLDHYKHPHNYGSIENADISHEEGNTSCGDKIKIDVKTKDGIIKEIKFTGKGCIVSQAAASILTDMVAGKSLESVRELTRDEMLENIGIPIGPMRLKCALLAIKVLKTGVYGQSGWLGEDEEEDE